MDYNPEKWFRYDMFSKLQETRTLIGEYINANPDDIVLLENASDAANTVLKSMLSPKDKILLLDIAYPMVQNTFQYIKDLIDIDITVIVLDKETINSDEKIIKKVEECVKKQGPFKLVCIDHISSLPSVILPIKELIKLIHQQENTIVLIDGAHTVGHIPLDILDLKPDFYFSNFHKWAFTPKSAAFLYVDKKYQEKIHPNVIGNNYKKGFIEEFNNGGTRDISAYIAVKDALVYRKELGDKKIMEYNHKLAWNAGNEVAKIWGTEILIEDEARIGAMVNVRLPCEDKEIIDKIVYKLLYENNTFLANGKYNDGNYYARFSAQIFNDLSDYILVAELFLKVMNDVKKEKN